MRTSYLPSLNCIAHKIQYISALYISIILATPLSRYSINICNYKNKIGWQYFFVAGTLSTNYHLEAELSFLRDSFSSSTHCVLVRDGTSRRNTVQPTQLWWVTLERMRWVNLQMVYISRIFHWLSFITHANTEILRSS